MSHSDRIYVHYDATDGSLTIDDGDLTLSPDTTPIHSLVWTFEGIDGLVAAGWAPGIRFRPGGSRTPRYAGPFSSLYHTGSAVIACGNTGEGGQYPYRAILDPPINSTLPKIRSRRARIYNEVPRPADNVIRVTPVPGTEGLLRLEPETVTYDSGQSIAWRVEEAPEEIAQWYPRLVFADGPGPMSSHFGPFTSLETRNDGVLGSGSKGQPGQYSYLFQMVSVEDGEVLFESTDDPTIDEEEDPEPQGSGG